MPAPSRPRSVFFGSVKRFGLLCNAQRRVSTRPSHAPASSRHVECTCSLILTSDAEGINIGGPCDALDCVRGVWGALLPMTSPYLSVRTFACVPHNVARMRPALCGPHASQPPATLRALALALAPAPARPARPRGLHPVRQRRRRVGHFACLPRLPAALPACLSGAGQRVLSPSPANRLSFIQPRNSFAEPCDSPTCDPARAGYRRSLPSRCARLPSLGPRGAAPAPQFRQLPSGFT
jgi:hypothetical protein